MSLPGGLSARPLAEPQATPRLVGTAWLLLVINVLGSFDKPDLLVPLPRPVAQAVTMGALVAAFALALMLNRRLQVRPNPYLLLLSLMLVVAIASTLKMESGIGAFFRCFRLSVFVATLWLLSRWWRGDLTFARFHLRALGVVLGTVLLGLIVKPSAATSAAGRLSGAIWPIPAPQVGLYAAVATGLIVILWFGRQLDNRTVRWVAAVTAGMLLLSHTRTAMLGLVVGLAVASLTLAWTSARVRRAFALALGIAAVVALAFDEIVLDWLQRGQDADQITSFTGRSRVWDALLEFERTPVQQLIGVGLTDKTFGGLPIDGNWLSTYHELGLVGCGIVVAMLVVLLVGAALRPPSPGRACAVFLVVYSIVASFTEVGLGDASPYLLNLAIAASLLVRDPATSGTAVVARPGSVGT